MSPKGKKKKQVKFVTSAYVFPSAEEDEEIEDSDEELPLWPFSAEMEDPLADTRHHFNYRGIAIATDSAVIGMLPFDGAINTNLLVCFHAATRLLLFYLLFPCCGFIMLFFIMTEIIYSRHWN